MLPATAALGKVDVGDVAVITGNDADVVDVNRIPVAIIVVVTSAVVDAGVEVGATLRQIAV
jgi:uncharacterized membrane protein